MSRHRNVRRMNYDEEYDGYDDVYGRSVEDDYCISPSTAEFMYDRTSQQQPMAAFIPRENIPEEVDFVVESEQGGLNARIERENSLESCFPELNPFDEARLRSCLDEIHNVVGDSFPEKVLIDAVISQGFDYEKSLNCILSSAEPPEIPKHQRIPQQRRNGDCQFENPHVALNQNMVTNSVALDEPNCDFYNDCSRCTVPLNCGEASVPISLNHNICTSLNQRIKCPHNSQLEDGIQLEKQFISNSPSSDHFITGKRQSNGNEVVSKDLPFPKLGFRFDSKTKIIASDASKRMTSRLSNVDNLMKSESQSPLMDLISSKSKFRGLAFQENKNAGVPAMQKLGLNQLASEHLASRSTQNRKLFSFMESQQGLSKQQKELNENHNVASHNDSPFTSLLTKSKPFDTPDANLSKRTSNPIHSSAENELTVDDAKVKEIASGLKDIPRKPIKNGVSASPSWFARILCLKYSKWIDDLFDGMPHSASKIQRFDFMLPSPDAVVLQHQEKAFSLQNSPSQRRQYQGKPFSADASPTVVESSASSKEVGSTEEALSKISLAGGGKSFATGFTPDTSHPCEQQSIPVLVPEQEFPEEQREGSVSSNEQKTKHSDGLGDSSFSSSGLAKSTTSRPRDVTKIDPEVEYQKARGTSKDLLNLVVIGHVDAGKSTLMGHLLCLLGTVSQKVIHKYEQESKKIGKASFMYAWVLDETGEERSRGVTMDIGYSKFETDNKIVTLIDAPGHKDFIPNMITGAAQADVAILVVDAGRGEFETGFETGGQTREHALLVRSLGVSQIIVAINKMDIVNWAEERYQEISNTVTRFLVKQTGFKAEDVACVPCSGLTGENLMKPLKEDFAKWYSGSTLIEQIDRFRPLERPLSKPFRMCVSDVFKGQGSAFNISGKVETGFAQAGEKVMVMPIGELAVIKTITLDDVPNSKAFAGDQVVVTLNGVDINSVTVGSVVCDPLQPIRACTLFRARIVVFNVEYPITKGFQAVLHFQSLCEPVIIKRILSQLHKTTGEVMQKKPRWLTKQSNAIVEISVSKPICMEEYKDIRELGRFMLRASGITVAAGIVVQVL